MNQTDEFIQNALDLLNEKMLKLQELEKEKQIILSSLKHCSSEEFKLIKSDMAENLKKFKDLSDEMKKISKKVKQIKMKLKVNE